MKKILTVFAALAMVAGLASSCQKEGASTDNPAQGKLVNVKLTAAFEGDSKVTYSETDNILTPAWEMDDAILVINPSVDPSTLTVTSIDGDGYATLEGTAEPGLVHLVYKKGITTGDWQGNKIDVDYDEQKVNDDMPAVMFADGQVSSNGSGSFQFRNAGAVIGIYNAKGVPAGSAISKVTLSGSNLSAATVSINGDALVLTATEKAKDAISTETLSDITVTTGETRALSEEILIAVPAGAKVEKVTLTVGEDTYSYTLAAAKTCNANDYLYVKTQEFKKDVVTTGTAKATIDGSEVDVNWVQLWENGPKFAEYNVGAENNKEEDYGGYYCWGGSYENGTGNPWNDDHNTTNTGSGNLSGDDD
ncbi:MAG: hypothetical protein MJY55_02470, partial [Bacteroidales bacterium]|nr:hypothetical protein [Bacteroidales bacterium]